MKIGTVTVENFISIGKISFALDHLGLVLLSGENRDNPSAISNGSGKSSLMDSVCWGLYGETARGVRAGDVVRHGQKNASVTIELMDDDGTGYTVTRKRMKASGRLTITQGANDLTLGTEALTQARLDKILGCGVEVFRAAVYLGQESMPDLPGMTDKKLKELIEEASGVGVLELAYARAREQSLVADRVLERTQMALTSVQEAVKRLAGETDGMGVMRATWENQRFARKEAETINAAAAQVERDNLLTSQAYGLDHVKLRAGLGLVETSLAGFTTAQAAERRLASDVGTAERVEATAGVTLRLALASMAKLQADADRLDGRVGQPCDACGHPLDAAALAHARQAAGDAIARGRDEAGKGAAVLKAAREALETARSALTTHRSTMGDPTALQAKAQGIRKLLDAHSDAHRQAADSLRRAQEAASRAAAVAVEVNPYDGMIMAKTREAADKATQEIDVTAARDAEILTVERLKNVVKVFGPAGVRAHILDQVTPYLNERTSAYLDALSDSTLKASWATLVKDSKGNLKEKFCIEVQHPAGDNFQTLSGGEKRKVRIACALALQDLVASRASKPFRLWVADEIDDALDSAGLERLMGVLEAKAKERGTVLVISHNDLTDWISDVWTMVKESGESRLEVE